MGRRAIVIGHGQIGRAVAARLARKAWQVRVLTRSGGVDGDGIRHIAVDRTDPAAFAATIGDGADLLLDTIAFDRADAERLLAVQGNLGAIAAISSISVYADAEGRCLEQAEEKGFSGIPERAAESHPTLAPGDGTYSARKVAMERALLDGARVPAAVLRAGTIHGIGSRHPREYWFARRILDGRSHIPLALMGESRFHTAGTANIAALVEAVVEARASGPFNAVDPDAPSAAEIGRTVAALLGVEIEWLPFPGFAGSVGRHPWTVELPYTLSDAAARAIGYMPEGSHAELMPPYLEWLAQGGTANWRERFPTYAGYPYDPFDYAAEDAAR